MGQVGGLRSGVRLGKVRLGYWLGLVRLISSIKLMFKPVKLWPKLQRIVVSDIKSERSWLTLTLTMPASAGGS